MDNGKKIVTWEMFKLYDKLLKEYIGIDDESEIEEDDDSETSE